MRSIFIYCLIFLSVVVHAQIYTNNGFQNSLPGYGEQRGWVYSKRASMPGSEDIIRSLTYNNSCNWVKDNVNYGGNIGMNNGYYDVVYTPTETANGEAITCSVDFKRIRGSLGDIEFKYSLDGGTTWIALGSKQNFINDCQTKTEVIPAGVVTAANSRQFRFMVRVSATLAAGTPESMFERPGLYIDDLRLAQKVLVAPSCPNLTTPANNASNISVRPAFSWSVPPGAYDYKLSIGTTSGGTDILNNATVNHDYAPAANKLYSPNTKYYAKLIATNPMGDSKGCAETTFTTGDNPFAPYCGPMISRTPTLMAPIISVDIAGTAYASDVTATTLGAFEPHQSFVDKVFTIKNNVKKVPITVKGIAAAQGGSGMSVFIDWNNDGNFDGAGEAYFNDYSKAYDWVLSSTIGVGNVITLMADLPIPVGTPLGKKRMRVKYSINYESKLHYLLSGPCWDLNEGQAEDYTISYEKYLAVSDVDKKNVSVYPNPFSDVLQFSEVKDAKSITVADASGKVVATPKVSQELNLSHLSKGAYFITVSYHNRPTKSFKVIKE